MASFFSNLFGYSSSTTSNTGAGGGAASTVGVGGAGSGANGVTGSVLSALPTGPTGPVGSYYTNPTTGITYVNTGSGWANIATGTASPYIGGGSGGVYMPTWSTTTVTSPLVIQTPDGRQIDVLKTLTTIIEQLCIIVPDETKMEKYPALREAYNEYLELMVNENVKKAYLNYRTIEALLNNSENQDE